MDRSCPCPTSPIQDQEVIASIRTVKTPAGRCIVENDIIVNVRGGARIHHSQRQPPSISERYFITDDGVIGNRKGSSKRDQREASSNLNAGLAAIAKHGITAHNIIGEA